MDATAQAALGFLTVVGDPQNGVVGGYLLLNLAGRPLEFHCTAPVKVTRAQRILYGPTLEPFLYGEQIGQTLVAKSSREPLVVFANQEPVLAVRHYVSAPVVLVLAPEPFETPESCAALCAGVGQAGHPMGDSAQPARPRLEPPHRLKAPWAVLSAGQNRLAVPPPTEENRRKVLERLDALPEWIDLWEPFGRICEAIEEARRGG